MTWKQPIPTNLDEIFGEDWGCNLLYRELIYRAANQDGFFTYKKKTTPIKRGQVVFGREIYALYLQRPKSTIRNWLEKLEKMYKLVDNQTSSNFTVVTIKNYDELTNMDKQMDKQRTSRGQAEDTSKSVKSVKNISLSAREEKIVLSSVLGIDSAKKGLFPCTSTEIWEVAMYLRIPLETVQRKHKRIMRMIDTGEFQLKYPKNKTTYTTLLNWLEGDVEKGTISELDEMGIEVLKIQKPNGIKHS